MVHIYSCTAISFLVTKKIMVKQNVSKTLLSKHNRLVELVLQLHPVQESCCSIRSETVKLPCQCHSKTKPQLKWCYIQTAPLGINTLQTWLLYNNFSLTGVNKYSTQ